MSEEVGELEETMEQLLARIAAEPGYLPHHQAAYRCAMKRKVLGGKPRGILARLKDRASTATERLVVVERNWLHNPFDLDAMVKVIEALAEVGRSGLGDVDEVKAWVEGLIERMRDVS